jgi:TonB family protein
MTHPVHEAKVFLRGDLRPRPDYFANPALNLAPFSRWTLRDKAAQRRLALRWASIVARTLFLLAVILSLCSCAAPTQRIAQGAHPISKSSGPYYPESARKQSQEGTATVKLVVLRDGTIKSASIERSSGFSALDDQAMKIIQEAKWTPAVATTGEPMDSTLVLPIVFRLKD